MVKQAAEAFLDDDDDDDDDDKKKMMMMKLGSLRRRTSLKEGGAMAALVVLIGGFLAFARALAPQAETGSRSVVVLGAMGSGTVAMTRSLRRLGLDVDHEATIGVDGVVGWIHALLYTREEEDGPDEDENEDPLCADGFFPGSWHAQLVAPEMRFACGDGSSRRSDLCWRAACPAALRRWRGCALRGDCLVPFSARPVVLVRHPLRTVESLVAGFCPKRDAAAEAKGVPQLEAALRLLPTMRRRRRRPPHASPAPLTLPCGPAFAAYWAAFYEALFLAESEGGDGMAMTWLRREDADACAVVDAFLEEGGYAVATTTMAPATRLRLDAAAATCRGGAGGGDALGRARGVVASLVEAAAEVGRLEFFQGDNAKNTADGAFSRVEFTWADLRHADPVLERRVASLARHLGFDDAPPALEHQQQHDTSNRHE